MKKPEPVTLSSGAVRLEPLTPDHVAGLEAAARDGELWTLGARLVGWRTDNFNFASQRAIERLGARKDGVLRHHALRRDGTVRDTVMYSLAAGEWPEVKAHLAHQLTRPREV